MRLFMSFLVFETVDRRSENLHAEPPVVERFFKSKVPANRSRGGEINE